jgi:hypothetical protein
MYHVNNHIFAAINRRGNKFFKTLAKLASSSEVLSLAKTENNWPKLYKWSVRGKKTLARLLASGLIYIVL